MATHSRATLAGYGFHCQAVPTHSHGCGPANNNQLTAQTQDMRHCNKAAHNTLDRQGLWLYSLRTKGREARQTLTRGQCKLQNRDNKHRRRAVVENVAVTS